MVRFRENKWQPHIALLTRTQVLPMAMGGKTFIQKTRHIHPEQLRQYQGEIGRLLLEDYSIETATPNPNRVSSFHISTHFYNTYGDVDQIVASIREVMARRREIVEPPKGEWTNVGARRHMPWYRRCYVNSRMGKSETIGAQRVAPD